MSLSSTTKTRPHYAWVIFVVAFITLLGAAGFRSTPAILIDPLREEFGWSRSIVGTAVSINVLLFGLMGPFAAALQLKYGLRRITIGALSVISLGALATTQMSAPWHLYLLWGAVVGTGSGCMATVFASTVASRWFVARRGLVTGALTAASASGQLVFLPLLTRLADNHGWRWVGITIALCALAVIPVVALFLRNSPSDIGLLPYGAPADYVAPTPITRPISAALGALNDARHDGIFWLLWGSFFVCGLSTNGLIGTHFIPAAHDHGMGTTVAASLLALVGVFDVIGTILSGYLTDKYDPRKLLFFYYGLRGLSLFLLPSILFSTVRPSTLVFVIFYGLDWIATVPPTLMLCRLVLGPERATVVYGWVFVGHQVGASIAALGAAVLRVKLGDYAVSFYIAAIMCIISAFAVLQIAKGKTSAELRS